jgi:DNA modification methylase
MSICNIENGDCLELMKELPDKSVDLFICDLPYVDINGNSETNCTWNQSVIDMDKFWEQFRRIRKSKRTACIHFCSTKFGYTLIKSWEGGYKMDMVWKKRNKTGGLQSRNRPMRNHEMVYFFYEQAPKYNRDKYHKRIVVEKKKEPPNPASVIDESYYTDKNGNDTNTFSKKAWKGCDPKFNKGLGGTMYNPGLPVSVLEEKFCKEYYETNKTGMTKTDIYSKEQIKKFHKENGVGFEPPNPVSVVEEDPRINEKGLSAHGWNIEHMDKPRVAHFDPKLPTSVVDEPVSMFESTKVFIGKRHHQTEKPQDILEFFLKYWTDEGDVVLDPTMGSGSTGVACKKLNRNFIGYEKDEKIYEVACKRLDKIKNKVI